MWGTHRIFESVVSAETPPTPTEGDRDWKKWEQAVMLPKLQMQRLG